MGVARASVSCFERSLQGGQQRSAGAESLLQARIAICIARYVEMSCSAQNLLESDEHLG